MSAEPDAKQPILAGGFSSCSHNKTCFITRFLLLSIGTVADTLAHTSPEPDTCRCRKLKKANKARSPLIGCSGIPDNLSRFLPQFPAVTGLHKGHFWATCIERLLFVSAPWFLSDLMSLPGCASVSAQLHFQFPFFVPTEAQHLILRS